jgi:hypothetical protein
LSTFGIELVLPVYDLQTKEAAVLELSANGLSSGALEQKCLRQITNVALEPEPLRREIDRWEQALLETLQMSDPF